MITIVLTLPSAPEVGGLDGSGGDTVEVIPMKIRTILHHPCILNLYPYNRIHLSMSMPTDCMLWYTAINCTCTILGFTSIIINSHTL